MKIIGVLVLLFFTAVGLERAFLFKEMAPEFLSTRQKIEITYRNALAVSTSGALNEDSLKSVENEIQILVKRDPFLNKKDRKWVKEKLKNLRTDNLGSLAMRTSP